MRKLLLVEDTPEIQLIVEGALGSQYEVQSASTIAEAKKAIETSEFEGFILDIQLPDGDGLRFCAELKSSDKHRRLPVFILTGQNTIQEKTLGFQLNIEDFIPKPFDPAELKLRVDARFRKQDEKKSDEQTLVYGDLQLHVSSQKVELRGKQGSKTIDLRAKEFRVLYFLAASAPAIKTRDQILSEVWGQGVHITDRTIDSHISRIRKKLTGSNVLIESISNVGYRIAQRGDEK